MIVELLWLSHGVGMSLPCQATFGAAGVDVGAALAPSEVLVLAPMERRIVPTGFCLGIPDGYEVQVRSRSGLCIKYGVAVLNSPGTIDCDYRGEVKIALINFGDKRFEIRRGDRIAQLVLSSVSKFEWKEVMTLDQTVRGGNGFGSTGR